jgi:intraflagellar transport protein 46
MKEAKKVENQPHDVEFELDDSEEIDTEEDPDQVPDRADGATSAVNAEEDYDQMEPIPGGYNAADYAGLNVVAEVRELFEYIGRFKPQRIDLETTFRPFIPEYMPNVGEVDAFIKMPKPDGSNETLGIEIIDEPNINTADEAFLEMKYLQFKKTTKVAQLKVHCIENAEKNTKGIENWIKNAGELHSSKAPATVNYAKSMPDFDKLMEIWPPSMEQAFREIQFPGPEIELPIEDYSRLICTMLDIPVHNLPDNKGVIEALHVVFTLFSEFKANQHFLAKQNQNQVYNNSEEF